MKLYIVRHGQSEWNALHKVCGATDAPLTEKGRARVLGEVQRLGSQTNEVFAMMLEE